MNNEQLTLNNGIFPIANKIQKLRTDFEILSQKVNNQPLIYFDNGATTQKPRQVTDLMQEYYTKWNANVHRGVHHLSNICTNACENARQTVADFLNAKSTNEIIFTSGTTDSINLVANTFCRKFVKSGDEILVSQMEHHSNFVPWQQMAEQQGATFKVFDITDNGELDIADFKKKLNNKTKIVVVTHVSNALGTINPVKEIIQLAHQQNIPVLIDGAQAIQHFKIDVQELDADFYAFSGHKMYGPTGIGVLFGKEKLLDDLPPYRLGGEMIKSVYNSHTVFNSLPFKFEAGTPNYIAQIGLGEAVRYIQNIGFENIEKHENELIHYFTEKISNITNTIIYANVPNKAGVISFNINGIHPYDIGTLLDKMGIAVRTGNHCAQPLFDRIGITGTVRVSFGIYNTKEEIDIFLENFKKILFLLQ